MDMVESNKAIIDYLHERFPDSSSDLIYENGFLSYQGESLDISDFDLKYLFNNIPEFDVESSFYNLNSKDIFKIIRLHVLFRDSLKLGSENKDDNSKYDDQQTILELKDDFPFFKHINIVNTMEDGVELEYIVIDDEDGVVHTFKNDSNVDVIGIYFNLSARNAGIEVTPSMMVHELKHKLKELNMDSASDLMNRSTTSEDFENKLRRVSEPYENDPSVHVYGSEDDDIALVSDSFDPSKKDIKTFEQMEDGDLVIETHNSNPNVSDNDKPLEETKESDVKVNDNNPDKVVIQLMPLEEFYKLYDSSNKDDFNKEQREQVELWYAFFGDLMLYEDYLLPELRVALENFRMFVDKIEVDETDDKPLTIRQQEIVDKRFDLEQKKIEVRDSLDKKKSEEYVKKLKLIMNEQGSNNNTGSVSILVVIGIILGVLIILTAVTMYLIG